MTFVKLLGTAAALCLATQAGAVVVSKTFSGTITDQSFNQPHPYALGTAFSGSFSYDTDAPIAYDGPNYNQYALANGIFTLSINGETYSNANLHPNIDDFIEVVDFGDLYITSYGMAGNGYLNGMGAGLYFQYSDDPSLAAQTLPMVLPTDFGRMQLRLFSPQTGIFQYGDFTIDSPPATHPVPEPAMLGLFGLAAIGLGLARRRRAA